VFAAGAFTVSFWFKPEDANGSEHYPDSQTLFSQGGTKLRLGPSSGLYGDFTNSSSQTTSTMYYTSLQDDTWYHVVLRLDAAGMSLSLGVDGANWDAGTYVSYTYEDVTPESGTAYLGRDSAGDNWFSGHIADVRIYDVALTDDELNDLARTQRPGRQLAAGLSHLRHRGL
jgi:hypothetical protein